MLINFSSKVYKLRPKKNQKKNNMKIPSRVVYFTRKLFYVGIRIMNTYKRVLYIKNKSSKLSRSQRRGSFSKNLRKQAVGKKFQNGLFFSPSPGVVLEIFNTPRAKWTRKNVCGQKSNKKVELNDFEYGKLIFSEWENRNSRIVMDEIHETKGAARGQCVKNWSNLKPSSRTLNKHFFPFFGVVGGNREGRGRNNCPYSSFVIKYAISYGAIFFFVVHNECCFFNNCNYSFRFSPSLIHRENNVQSVINRFLLVFLTQNEN